MENLICFSMFYIGFWVSYNLQVPDDFRNIHCVLTHSNFRMCCFYLTVLLNGSSHPIHFRYLVWLCTLPLLVWQLCILFYLYDTEERFWSLLLVHYLAVLSFWVGDTFVFLKAFSFILSSSLYSHCFRIIETPFVMSSVELFHILLYFKTLYFFYGISFLISNYPKRILIYNILDIYLFFIPIFFQENIELTKKASFNNDFRDYQ